MATVISAEVFKANAEGVRASVNNHVFIECGVMQANAAAVDCKVRAGVGADIVTVDSWDPADNSYNHEHLAPFSLNCHAHVDSTEYTKLYDDGATFGTGTYSDTAADDDGLLLSTTAPFIDFEDYTLNANLIAAGQPDSWTKLDQKNDYDASIRADPDGLGEQSVRWVMGSSRLLRRYDDATAIGGVVTGRFMFPAAGNLQACIFFQSTGAGTAMRGYVCYFSQNSIYTTFARVNDWDSWYGIRSDNHGKTITTGDWWWFKVRFYDSSGTTGCQYKLWKEGDSEPASYSWGGSDSVYNQTGYVGMGYIYPTGWWTTWSDDFSFQPDPAVYYSSGNWESGNIDTTSIKQYSAGVIEWDETTPTDTTVAVKARWRNGGTWLACTSGSPLPGITAGEDTKAGSSKDSLELRVELATTDTSATPRVDNLRVYHEPFANIKALVNIDATGADIDCTEANGYLDIWGKWQVDTGARVTKWDDVWLATFQPYKLLGAGKAIGIKFNYDVWEIDSIVVNLKPDYWMVLNDRVGCYYTMNPIKYASAPVEGRWNCQEPWFPGGHVYEWVLIDYSMGMRADANFLVGHYQLDDIPGFYIAGALNLGDHPGFYLAEGWARDDHTGFYLSQSWQRDDAIGFYMPGITTFNDHVGFFITAIRELHDQPGAYLVRGVNSDGAIEASIIDADTWAELVARGYTRG